MSRELKQYLAANSGLTADELKELKEWVADGNSARDNPYGYADESGQPLDFVMAARLLEDIQRHPEDYSF